MIDHRCHGDDAAYDNSEEHGDDSSATMVTVKAPNSEMATPPLEAIDEGLLVKHLLL